MLSERERQELASIEDRIRIEDPHFAESFRTGSFSRRRPRRWPYTAAVVTTLLLLTGCVVLALPGAALLSASLVVAALALRWLRAPSSGPADF